MRDDKNDDDMRRLRKVLTFGERYGTPGVYDGYGNDWNKLLAKRKRQLFFGRLILNIVILSVVVFLAIFVFCIVNSKFLL